MIDDDKAWFDTDLNWHITYNPNKEELQKELDQDRIDRKIKEMTGGDQKLIDFMYEEMNTGRGWFDTDMNWHWD